MYLEQFPTQQERTTGTEYTATHTCCTYLSWRCPPNDRFLCNTHLSCFNSLMCNQQNRTLSGLGSHNASEPGSPRLCTPTPSVQQLCTPTFAFHSPTITNTWTNMHESLLKHMCSRLTLLSWIWKYVVIILLDWIGVGSHLDNSVKLLANKSRLG